MAAGTYDITIEAGSTYTMVVTCYDSSSTLINLTGYTARMQIRQTLTSSTTLWSLTSGSGITLGGSAGTITITISASSTTSVIGTTESTAVYDLEIESGGGIVTRILQGRAFLSPEVTR